MKRSEELLTEKQVWVVLGVNPIPDKFANRIFRKLKEHGKTVYGVNPLYDRLNGEKVYAHFTELPEKVDVVVSVVNPIIGLDYVAQIHTAEVPILWLQPGTVSDDLLKLANEHGIEVIQDCVLVSYDLLDAKLRNK